MEIEYVASACLCGLNCRYDGKTKPKESIVKLFNAGKVLPLCPENLGGLQAPRAPCEWQNGRAMDRNGRNLTENFERGSEIAMQKALASGCRKAILKSRSPSCGVGHIYDGTFTGTLRSGNGLWAEKLLKAGFEIFTEDDFEKLTGFPLESSEQD